MDKKTKNTIIFTIVASILDIILTILLIGAIIAVIILGLKLLKVQNPTIILGSMLLALIAGFIISMLVYAKLTSWVILKFNLADKLDPKIMGKRLPNGASINNKPVNDNKDKIKTNMPDSVKEEEDDWGK